MRGTSSSSAGLSCQLKTPPAWIWIKRALACSFRCKLILQEFFCLPKSRLVYSFSQEIAAQLICVNLGFGSCKEDSHCLAQKYDLGFGWDLSGAMDVLILHYSDIDFHQPASKIQPLGNQTWNQYMWGQTTEYTGSNPVFSFCEKNWGGFYQACISSCWQTADWLVFVIPTGCIKKMSDSDISLKSVPGVGFTFSGVF